ncbi:MAG: hypothetical protein IV107_25160 [Paucibacter sp.]|nr:hypothetical protein [Roseateles sp.]
MNIIIVRVLALVFILCAMSFEAFAYGFISSAKVVQVRIDQDGRGMVIFDKAVGNEPPSCIHAAAYSNALEFDTRTPGGNAIMALALTAKSSNQLLSVYGSGRCEIYGGHVEDWSYGVVH